MCKMDSDGKPPEFAFEYEVKGEICVQLLKATVGLLIPQAFNGISNCSLK